MQKLNERLVVKAFNGERIVFENAYDAYRFACGMAKEKSGTYAIVCIDACGEETGKRWYTFRFDGGKCYQICDWWLFEVTTATKLREQKKAA